MDALCFGFRFPSGSLDTCLKAEETMRKEYARAYSQGHLGTAVGEANDPSVCLPSAPMRRI